MPNGMPHDSAESAGAIQEAIWETRALENEGQRDC
jgi:hypothetical protein